MSQPRLYKRRWFQFLIGLSITAACLAWALYSMKSGRPWRDVLQEIAAAFRQADYSTLLLLWIILAVFYWLKGVRWKLLLAPVGEFHATRDLLPPIMAGFAGNNLLPARIGELIRVLLFSRSQRVPMATALASVAVERILDALTILVLLGIGIARLEKIDPGVHRVLQTGSVAIGAAAACIVIYLIWTERFIRLAAWGLQRVPLLPTRFGEKIVGLLETASIGLAALKRGRLLAGILATSVAQWILNATFIACSVHAFQIDLPWEAALVLMGVVAFGVAVPSAPGFFGVMQVYFLLVLKMFPYTQERIFAASLYCQLAQYVPVTVIGVICAHRLGFGFREAPASVSDASTSATEMGPEALAAADNPREPGPISTSEQAYASQKLANRSADHAD